MYIIVFRQKTGMTEGTFLRMISISLFKPREWMKVPERWCRRRRRRRYTHRTILAEQGSVLFLVSLVGCHLKHSKIVMKAIAFSLKLGSIYYPICPKSIF